jgi:hypothetical protein
VSAALEREIRELDPDSPVRVDTAFECPRLAAPRWTIGLRSHGHGGDLELLGAYAPSEDRLEVREVILHARTNVPSLEDPPASFAIVRATAAGEAARHALAFARAAMAARVALLAPPPPAANVLSITTNQTDDDEEVELRTSGLGVEDLARQWQGYRATDSEAERAPIELAFDALAGLLSGAAQVTPDEQDRNLLADSWDSRFPHAWWVEEGLLDLASVLATHRLLPKAAAALSSPREGEQTRAVRALAAITGHDRIRDAHGAVRPLAVLVAEYRAQVGESR